MSEDEVEVVVIDEARHGSIWADAQFSLDCVACITWNCKGWFVRCRLFFEGCAEF